MATTRKGINNAAACYVPLTRGEFAIVDSEDQENIEKFNWFCMDCNGILYAARWSKKSEGRSKRLIFMHRFLSTAVAGSLDVDHKNHNGLDNRKENLRGCTRSQNNYNLRKNSKNTSGFKGVYYEASRDLWCAKIRIEGVRKNLGRFKTPEEAHEAYCEASIEHHKEFGCFE